MTQVRIEVRPLAAGDVMAWRAIRLEALGNAPEAFGQTLEHAQSQPIDEFLRTVSGAFPPFAAFHDATIVGTAGFHVLGGAKTAHRGMLWGMYVTPAYRRLGVARRLIETVVDHARGQVEQIHLHVVTANTAAYGLYRDMGFVTYGVVPRALRHAGRDCDEALMVRMLDQGR